MKKLEVRRSDFSRVGDDKLTVFAQTVITNMTGKERYASVRTAFDPFKIVADEFDAKLMAAKGKASKDVTEKNFLKAELKAHLLRLSTMMEANHDDEESYFIEAGFNLTKPRKPKAFDNSPLLLPSNIKIYSLGEVGALHIDFDRPKDKRFFCIQVCRSADNGETWTTEDFLSEPSNLISNVPSKIDMLFKFRSIGKDNRIGEWSEIFRSSAR